MTNLDLDRTVTLRLDQPLWPSDVDGSDVRTTVRTCCRAGSPVVVPTRPVRGDCLGGRARARGTGTRSATRHVADRDRGRRCRVDAGEILPSVGWSRGIGAAGDPVSVFQAGGTSRESGRAVLHWSKAGLRDALTYREISSGAVPTGRWLNNLYWLVARSGWYALEQMLDEATAFQHDPDQIAVLRTEPAPAPSPERIETLLHRPARWDDVERVVLNWRDADSLAQALRQAEELEAFAKENGHGFEVALHRDGEPPLHLYRHPWVAVAVAGGTPAAPATAESLLRARSPCPTLPSSRRGRARV